MEKINLDEDTSSLMAWFAGVTGLTASDIIDRLLSAHLPELWELRAFLEKQPRDTEQYEQGKNLLVSFGPESVMSGIQRIAPASYTTLEARFQQSLNDRSEDTGARQ